MSLSLWDLALYHLFARILNLYLLPKEFREAQLETPHADVARQLASTQDELRRAEERAQKALESKSAYKDQAGYPHPCPYPFTPLRTMTTASVLAASSLCSLLYCHRVRTSV